MRIPAAIILAALLSGCLGLEAGNEASTTTTLPAAVMTTRTTQTQDYAMTTYTVTTSTAQSAPSTAATSTTWAGECPKGYARAVVGCCVDINGNGLCDRAEKAATTTTTLSADGFGRLFRKVANMTDDMPLENGTSVNGGFNYPATSSTLIEGITPAYQNNYNIIDLGPDSDWRAENVSGCKVVRKGGRVLMYCSLKNLSV